MVTMEGLHEEQMYVADIASKLGIQFEIKVHPYPTKTCREKAELLGGWPLDRIVKAVYFCDGGPFIGVVVPGVGRIDQKDVLTRADPSLTWDKACGYSTKSVPRGMRCGTCTPFPLESLVGSEIGRIVFCSYQPVEDKVVDISLGGCDEYAMKLSMHIQYGDICRILRHKFGDSIVRV